MQYDAVVLDNDGVLTTMTDRSVLREAIESTFAEFGVHDPPEEHVERLYGVTVDDIETVCSAHDLDPASFWRRRDENAAAVQIREIDDGTKRLYDDVAALDVLSEPLGLVSNNQHRTVEYIVDRFGLADRFGPVYGRRPTLEDVVRKKPDPFYIERALDDLDTSEALYVGDSEKDIVAAQRAGVDAAFVRRGHRAETELSVQPDYEIPNLERLVKRLR